MLPVQSLDQQENLEKQLPHTHSTTLRTEELAENNQSNGTIVNMRKQPVV
jgi:hypothetical protein